MWDDKGTHFSSPLSIAIINTSELWATGTNGPPLTSNNHLLSAAPCRPSQASRGREEALRCGGKQHFPGVHPQISSGQSHLDLPETSTESTRRGQSDRQQPKKASLYIYSCPWNSGLHPQGGGWILNRLRFTFTFKATVTLVHLKSDLLRTLLFWKLLLMQMAFTSLTQCHSLVS